MVASFRTLSTAIVLTAFLAGLLLASPDVKQQERLPFCPEHDADSPSASRSTNSNVLLVATLDGRVSALDPADDGRLMWSVGTGPAGDMLSSTISQLELTNNAKWVKLIPSLGGGLYKFDGETVEAVPLSAEDLLRSSFKFADNTVITGGKESRTFGIEMDSGRVLYECSLDGCSRSDGAERNTASGEEEHSLDDIIVIQRQTQTVRAVEPRTGQEKWNFSVSQHKLEFHPGVRDLCEKEPSDESDLAEDNVDDDSDDAVHFKAVVADGVICSVQRQTPDVVRWSHKFATPIVHAWHVINGKVIKVDLFSSSRLPTPQALPSGDQQQPEENDSPMLYLGTHKHQLYIQENERLRPRGPGKKPLVPHTGGGLESSSSDGNGGSSLSFPRVSWHPYLISSASRTPTYNHGTKDTVPLLTYDEATAEKTALAVFKGGAATDYPFDSGLYLFPDKPDLEYDPILDYDENTTAKSQQETTEAPEDDDVVHVVIVGLWYWWKEVVLISIVTAIAMNVMITRPVIAELRERLRRSYELLARKPHTNVVFVEVPVKVPFTTQESAISVKSSSDSLTSQSDGNSGGQEFVSRYLADFEPVQCLGKGGFGVVFEAKNKLDELRYAVKRIRLPQSEGARRKVMREVRFLAKLDHKNIVRYFNTWIEKPPQGWQESQDTWWREGGEGSTAPDASKMFSTRTGFSGSSANYGSSSLSLAAASANRHHSFRKCDKNDSFSIVFEQSEDGADDDEIVDNDESDVVVFEREESRSRRLQMEAASKSSIGCDTSLDDDDEDPSCAEALPWAERKAAAAAAACERAKARSSEPDSHPEPVYLYIVMQLCAKESLRDWLRSCTLTRSRKRSLLMFSEICSGVEYVHSKGLIHRDLKPSNILFDPDGTIKIGDFGLVTGIDPSNGDSPDDVGGGDTDNKVLALLGPDAGHAHHTDQVGTELYCAPEQFSRKPYNHKVDIYSLGVILFELLVPFGTEMERVRTLTDARKLVFPEHFEKADEFALVRAMLSHDPAERPEMADVFEEDLVRNVLDEVAASPGRDFDAGGRRMRRTTSSSTSSVNPEE